MIVINKDYFKDKPEYSYLSSKIDDSFELTIGDKSKIVFGFNGIGKSSISSCLTNYNESNNFRFLDYETETQKYSGNEIVISPYIFEINKLEKKMTDEMGTINSVTLIKKNGFNKTKAKKGPQFLKTHPIFTKKDDEYAELKTDDKTYLSFISKHKLSNPNDFSLLVTKLSSVLNSKNEIESFKNTKYKDALVDICDYIVEDNCPVCDSNIPNLKEIIDEKIAKLSAYKSELIEMMEEHSINHDSATIADYISLYNDLSSDEDLLNDYMLCGNNLDLRKLIEKTAKEIKADGIKLSTLSIKKAEKYNEIKTLESNFKKDICRYLKIDSSSISFDDSKNEIIISLDRDAVTYSTGERHILWFLIEIYSFLGSDSSVFVLDDPASSLDLINLYKIAFEIVKNANKASKSIIVFTHSSDLVNAVNSQRGDFLDFYYLEEYQQKIYCEEIDYKGKNIDNIIDTKRFCSFTPKIYDSLKLRDFEGYTGTEHLVYHFSLTVNSSTIDTSLSNHYLCNLIDNYVVLPKHDFYENSFNKVLHILALRVWLEKALYNLIPSSSSEDQRRTDYLRAYMLFQKIAIIGNDNGHYISNLFETNGIRREDILSKKVMLNQNAHYYSQIMPFAYAINLSIDDIDREIKEIKEIFE